MCPDCNEPLVIFELQGVEVDHCLTCRGTWLDAGELGKLTESAGVDAGDLTRALGGAWKGPRTGRRCPRCGKKLRLIRLGRDGSVEVDRCPRGHGLWLDAGETESVIRSYAGDEEDGTVARFFSDLYQTELGRDVDAS